MPTSAGSLQVCVHSLSRKEGEKQTSGVMLGASSERTSDKPNTKTKRSRKVASAPGGLPNLR
eukprot:5032410-Heterocapsa_arctica.AAC.1